VAILALGPVAALLSLVGGALVPISPAAASTCTSYACTSYPDAEAYSVAPTGEEGPETTEWMSSLPGGTRLSALSIPGTHESGATHSGNAEFGVSLGEAGKVVEELLGISFPSSLNISLGEGLIPVTQTMSITGQLRAGIRALDIRVGERAPGEHHGECAGNTSELFLFHGNFDGGVCEHTTLKETVLPEVSDFLHEHPGETVVMRLGNSGTPNADSQIEGDICSILEPYAAEGLLYKAGKDNQLPDDPSLAEMRGKIVVFKDWSEEPGPIEYHTNSNGETCDYKTFMTAIPYRESNAGGLEYGEGELASTYQMYGQDEEDQSLDGMATKWRAIREQFDRAAAKPSGKFTADTVFYNYLSAVGESGNGDVLEGFPCRYASGKEGCGFPGEGDAQRQAKDCAISLLCVPLYVWDLGGFLTHEVAGPLGLSCMEFQHSCREPFEEGLYERGDSATGGDTCLGHGYSYTETCSVYYEGENMIAEAYIDGSTPEGWHLTNLELPSRPGFDTITTRTGIVMADFPGSDLIRAVMAVDGRRRTTTTLALRGPGETRACTVAACAPGGQELAVTEGAAVLGQATLLGEDISSGSGTVTYRVYRQGSGSPSCEQAAAERAGFFTEWTAPVTSGAVAPSPPVTLAPGVYLWQAEYSGDEANESSVTECGSEVETVRAAHPAASAIATSLEQVGDTANHGPTVTVPEGAEVIDTAQISGSPDPYPGGVSFKVYYNSECTKPLPKEYLGSEGLRYIGGTSTTAVPGQASANVTPFGQGPGRYYVQVEYAGDATNINRASKSKCGEEVLIVKAPTRTPTLSTALEGEEQVGTDITVKEGRPVTDYALLEAEEENSYSAGFTSQTAEQEAVKFKVFKNSACTEQVATPPSLLNPGGGVLGQWRSSPVELSQPGTYYFEAEFSGDETSDTQVGGNHPATSKCGSEKLVVVARKEAKITTKLDFTAPTITVAPEDSIEDAAYVVGENPTGTVTFRVYSDSSCTKLVTANQPVELDSFTGEAVSEEVGGLAPGKYYWQVEYSGDANNAPSTSQCGEEVETVERPSVPSLTIELLQRIKGGGAGFTKQELTAEAGQTVEYEAVFHNTGDVELELSKFKDFLLVEGLPSCEHITAGSSHLKEGESTTYTCEYTITAAGSLEDVVDITVGGGLGEHDAKVALNVPRRPFFTIERLQRIEGLEKVFTMGEVIGKIGDTVEYETVIRNTGNVPLEFDLTFADLGSCETFVSGSARPLKPGEEAALVCESRLRSVGQQRTVSEVEGNEGTGKKKSDELVVDVPGEPSFTIEKLQEVAGSHTGFTAEELDGKTGQTVDYEVVVENTGNVPLTFDALADAGCEGVSPAGEVTVAVGGKQTYTCSHTLAGAGEYPNEASIEDNYFQRAESNQVVVVVEEEPSFTIEKLQRVDGVGGFTRTELGGKIGQTVEYQMVVRNTGNLSLRFAKLSDSGCEGIAPAGEATVAAGGQQTYTCHHTLGAVRSYSNEASIEDNRFQTATSNRVVVSVPEEPSFTIENEAAGSFTKHELFGKPGQTVEYDIVVKNIGNVALKFGKLGDLVTEETATESGKFRCEAISPGGEVAVAVGGEQTYTCHYKLMAVGKYTAEATIEDNHGQKETSNRVLVTVVGEPSFTIEKLQELEGTGTGLTKAELSATVGENVVYEIVVKNTGDVALTFHELSDPDCEAIAPSGEATLPAGEEGIYYCFAELRTPGKHTNEASIEDNYGAKETSNQVVVNVPAEPAFTIEKLQSVEDAGFTKGEVTGKLGRTVDYEVVVTNTGDVPLEFGKLTDGGCEAIAPAGEVEVPVGGQQVYTCQHVLTNIGAYENEASIEDGYTHEEASNKVLINTPSPLVITQRTTVQGCTSGCPPETNEEYEGELEETFDFTITVVNGGVVPVTVGPPTDPECEDFSPPGEVEIKPGGKVEYTCHHKVAAYGTWESKPTVPGCIPGITCTTGEGCIPGIGCGGGCPLVCLPIVFPPLPPPLPPPPPPGPPPGTVKVKTEENNDKNKEKEKSFTITKYQELEGKEGSPLTGKVKQTVEYRIVVDNTGEVALTFSDFSDPGCENVVDGSSSLGPGDSTTYTCEYRLTKPGTHMNVASIEGSEGTGVKASNEVEVDVPEEPSFTIEKVQKIEGGKEAFTNQELTGEVGQTVDYHVIVKNTGNVPLKFKKLTDTVMSTTPSETEPGKTETNHAECEDVAPQDEVEVMEGDEQEYACEYKLTTTGKYTNEASIEASTEGGYDAKKTSNEVTATVPECKTAKGVGHLGPKGPSGLNEDNEMSTDGKPHGFSVSLPGRHENEKGFQLKSLEHASCVRGTEESEFSGEGSAKFNRQAGYWLSFAFVVKNGGRVWLEAKVTEGAKGPTVYELPRTELNRASKEHLS
jgi:uncharacterized repeat protein (TIGR01451 family)